VSVPRCFAYPPGLQRLLNLRNETGQWALDRKDFRELTALVRRRYDCDLVSAETLISHPSAHPVQRPQSNLRSSC
jgi:hypothetical protein